MSHITPAARIDTRPLFAPLHQELMMTLRTLAPEDWTRQTAAPRWRVADVAAHLLDTAIRTVSSHRDNHELLRADRDITTPGSLTAFINDINAQWVEVAARFSPRLLTELLDIVGRQQADYFESAELDEPARIPVSWAGESQSAAWFHIGREYTERWHHQQQIAEAVGAPLLVSRRWLHPVLALSMRALPVAYRDVDAALTTGVTFEITGDAGGAWTLVRESDGWRLFVGALTHAAAHVRVDQDIAWRMFFNQRTRAQVLDAMAIGGNHRLAEPFAGVLAVIA